MRYVSGAVARGARGGATGCWGAAAAAGWPMPGPTCIVESVAVGTVAKPGSTVGQERYDGHSGDRKGSIKKLQYCNEGCAFLDFHNFMTIVVSIR